MPPMFTKCFFFAATSLLIGGWSTQSLAADPSHVIHSETRDEMFQGVEMTIELMDAFAERQETVMNRSFRMQYENQGYDLHHLPEVTYNTSTLTVGSDETIGIGLFTIQWEPEDEQSFQHSITLIGIEDTTLHKVACNGVTNPFEDRACLDKAKQVFGRLTPS